MSLRKAIDDMCKSCIYDPFQLGTWRIQVEECTSVTCPLHKFRPKSVQTVQKMAEGSDRSERMKQRHKEKANV